MLESDQLEFLMEAHNGLSARIVREAGFSGIWASGLSISAPVRGPRQQRGELDPGRGHAGVHGRRQRSAHPAGRRHRLRQFQQPARRLVRKLEQRGIAGVCIEDKQFPKTNSFLNGERAAAGGHRGVRRQDRGAARTPRRDPNFSIVARVEALIAGWGMEEALRRAEAYRRAGADAILIHSKLVETR